MIPAKPFYMIRHGESTANRDGFFSGQLNVPLTELGRRQAENARAFVENLTNKPDKIFHSHLDRAIDTAKTINTSLCLPMIEDSRLAEHGFGEWEGQPPGDIRPLVDKGINPPGGEPHMVFYNRVRDGIIHAMKNGNLPLIVCHGGCFRAFGGLYGTQIRGIKNCTLYHFEPANAAPMPWTLTLIGEPEEPAESERSDTHHGHEKPDTL